jgi:diguanylate cyclase (GGDEF)-like protein
MNRNDAAAYNAVTLTFRERSLDTAFRNDYLGKTMSQVRLSLLLGVFLYAVFGVVDCFIIPEIRPEAWFIRYYVVCPLIIAVYFLSYTRHFLRLMQPSLVIAGFVAGSGIVAMIVINPSPSSYLYFAGLLLCLMFFYSFVSLRFIASTILCWGIFVLYEVMIIWKAHLLPSILMHNTFVLLAFNVTGMWASYSRERYMRSDFIQRRTILNQTEQVRGALLDVEKARREAEGIARLDPLTNLYNRRHFHHVAELEFAQNRRCPDVMAIMMMDIDHFKSINDTCGHHAGDLFLQTVADRLRSTVRRSDIPCRYGGEEFAIVLPHTGLAAATVIGERLRETIEAMVIEIDGKRILTTASLGIAVIPEGDLSDLETWIKRADLALYEAKQGGRNLVKVWNPGNALICTEPGVEEMHLTV